MSYSLPKSLPRDDKAGIRAAIAALGSVGYRPWQMFDPDIAEWVDFDGADVVAQITGVDDAQVMFEHKERGNAFYVRFVMGNDPSEVICDYSWKESEDEIGWDAFIALNALIDRWIEIESGVF